MGGKVKYMEENKNSLLARVILVGEIAEQEFSKK